MKKMVIVCNHFAPDNTIAAIRITKFAKYLQEHGYEVTVIAEHKDDDIEDEILKNNAVGIHTIRIDNSKSAKKWIMLYKKWISPIKNKKYNNLDNRMRLNRRTGKYEFYPFETAYPFIGSLDYLTEVIRQYDLFKMSKKYLKKCHDLNYVFSSYGDFFGIFAGKYLHKMNKNIPWIFDIRDAVCRYKFTPKYVQGIARFFENYVYKEAACIIGVSKGICRQVPRKYQKKVHCVTNGYDRNDRAGIPVTKNEKNVLRFAYTGAMYGGLQNLSPFFESISYLIKQEYIGVHEVEFCFAGKETAYQIFCSQAERYGLAKRCIYCGRLTHKDALKLQMESDVLLVSSFDYQTGTGGVITGKALEYMSADKPIIAIINGDIVHSELAAIIQSAGLGIAYEESHCEIDRKRLCHYLINICKQFRNEGLLTHNPNKEVLKRFDYQYLCKKLLRIVEEL